MSTKVAGVRLKARESICRSSKHSTTEEVWGEDEFQGIELERKECFVYVDIIEEQKKTIGKVGTRHFHIASSISTDLQP